MCLRGDIEDIVSLIINGIVMISGLQLEELCACKYLRVRNDKREMSHSLFGPGLTKRDASQLCLCLTYLIFVT